MNAPIPTQAAQLAWINELLHRMTTAESRAVRMQLCAELKLEIAAYLESAGSK